MSHCIAKSGSAASFAGRFGRSPMGGPNAVSSVLSVWIAKPVVEAAPETRLSRSTLERKAAESERAITTPICG